MGWLIMVVCMRLGDLGGGLRNFSYIEETSTIFLFWVIVLCLFFIGAVRWGVDFDCVYVWLFV